MSMPDDKSKRSATDRFRNIMSADQGGEDTSASRRYPKNTGSPSLNLPAPRRQDANAAPPSSPAPLTPKPSVYRADGNGFLPAFWTIASIISLLFNVVMLAVVVGLLRQVGNIDAASIGSGVLGGLYTNFERMDQAHIKTTIPIETTIPLNLNIPVQTTTGISLARDVSIPGAHVKISTPLFNIDAPANVTLPAGTSMDVTMSFDVPVQANVPISLQVPVDIPLQDTELHPAISGLQETIRPLYCIVSPSAQTLSGEPVCK
jgi:hypothetical protein